MVRDFDLVDVMFEAGDQLVAGDGSGPEFADYDRARMICDLRSLERRRVANQRECEHRDGSVACAGNIKHIARLCRDVMRMFSLLEKHHALFAKSDEQILNAPLLKQLFPGVDKIDIFLRRHIGIAAGDSGGKESFRAIRFHGRSEEHTSELQSPYVISYAV